jgi:hypothetical protein
METVKETRWIYLLVLHVHLYHLLTTRYLVPHNTNTMTIFSAHISFILASPLPPRVMTNNQTHTQIPGTGCSTQAEEGLEAPGTVQAEDTEVAHTLLEEDTVAPSSPARKVGIAALHSLAVGMRVLHTRR